MFKVFDERNLPENIRAANYGGVEMVFREFKDKYKEAGGKQKPCLELSDTSRGFVLYRQASV